MADHPEAFGPDEPSPLPEGEFKSEFFGGMGSKPSPAAEPPTLASLPPAPQEERRGHPAFPVVLGAIFLAVIAVAAVMNRTPAPEPAATPVAAAPAAAETPAPVAETPAKEADVKALAESLKAEIASLAKEIKDLDGRVAALPKPAPAPDLAPLNTKIAALAKSIDAVQPLSKKVDALDEQLGGLSTSLKSLQEGNTALKDQVASLRDEMKKPAAAAAESTREAAKPVNVNVEGQSFAQAAELFKAGRYKEASDVLKTTEDNDQKDARVWYYAALSSGLATGDWNGSAQRLVMKGVDREKAGTPAVGDIDSEFAKLPASQKAWLDAYRKLAQKTQ